MARGLGIGRYMRRRSLPHWKAAANMLGQMTPAQQAETLRQAAQLRQDLDRLLAQTDPRQTAQSRGYDWIWRPEALRSPLVPSGAVDLPSGSAFGLGLSLFHDSTAGDITLSQIDRDEGGHALRLDSFRSNGSFASLVMDVPPDGLRGLSRTHSIGLATRLSDPVPLTLRLNVEIGPNTEMAVQNVEPGAEGHVLAHFDLAQVVSDPAPITAVWVDVIREVPQTSSLTFDDLALLRRPPPIF